MASSRTWAKFSLLIAAASASSSAASFDETVKPFVRQYCVACHNSTTGAGGVDFQQYLNKPAAEAFKDAAVWDSFIRVLRAEQMPPRRSRQPPEEQVGVVTTWIEAQLIRASGRP